MLIGSISINAQVGVETQIIRGDGIMDFPENAIKGILLPRVTNTASISSNGTVGGAIAFNMFKNRVEYYNPDRSSWLGLSEATTIAVSPHSFNNVAEEGVIISDGTGSTPPAGVLVLESSSKAIILPQVADVTLLPSPQAGTICYDMASKSLAVYNGNEWSFWN